MKSKTVIKIKETKDAQCEQGYSEPDIFIF